MGQCDWCRNKNTYWCNKCEYVFDDEYGTEYRYYIPEKNKEEDKKDKNNP
jgi:rubredoxin